MPFVAKTYAGAGPDLLRLNEETAIRPPTVDAFRNGDLPFGRSLIKCFLEIRRHSLTDECERNVVQAALRGPLGLILAGCCDEADEAVVAVVVALYSHTVPTWNIVEA